MVIAQRVPRRRDFSMADHVMTPLVTKETGPNVDE